MDANVFDEKGGGRNGTRSFGFTVPSLPFPPRPHRDTDRLSNGGRGGGVWYGRTLIQYASRIRSSAAKSLLQQISFSYYHEP